MNPKNLQHATWIFAIALSIGAVALSAQRSPEELQQRVAQIKQSIAKNREAMKQYSWTETTEISLKGDVKKSEQKECHYGPDGKVQKTPLGVAAPEQPKEQGGRRGRRKGRIKAKIVEKKVGELKDYGERFGSLIKRYVPPDGDRLKAAHQAGNASLDRSSSAGQASLVIRNYYKEGDQLALTFDTAAKALQSYNVKSYLDGPEDVVSLDVSFRSLPDGTSYVGQTDLHSEGKKLDIKVVNAGHRKLQ